MLGSSKNVLVQALPTANDCIPYLTPEPQVDTRVAGVDRRLLGDPSSPPKGLTTSTYTNHTPVYILYVPRTYIYYHHRRRRFLRVCIIKCRSRIYEREYSCDKVPGKRPRNNCVNILQITTRDAADVYVLQLCRVLGSCFGYR